MCNPCLFGLFQAICSGDFILSQASMELARIRNTEVVQILSQVLEDLVKGEFPKYQCSQYLVKPEY